MLDLAGMSSRNSLFLLPFPGNPCKNPYEARLCGGNGRNGGEGSPETPVEDEVGREKSRGFPSLGA